MLIMKKKKMMEKVLKKINENCNLNILKPKTLKSNGSVGEMRSCRKYIRVRASSKISRKKNSKNIKMKKKKKMKEKVLKKIRN